MCALTGPGSVCFVAAQEKRDYYEVLGVDRSAGAKELKKVGAVC
jgi:hypothetical protein